MCLPHKWLRWYPSLCPGERGEEGFPGGDADFRGIACQVQAYFWGCQQTRLSLSLCPELSGSGRTRGRGSLVGSQHKQGCGGGTGTGSTEVRLGVGESVSTLVTGGHMRTSAICCSPGPLLGPTGHYLEKAGQAVGNHILLESYNPLNPSVPALGSCFTRGPRPGQGIQKSLLVPQAHSCMIRKTCQQDLPSLGPQAQLSASGSEREAKPCLEVNDTHSVYACVRVSLCV